MGAATELKKGSYFIYNNELVRVLRRELVAVGTHSHSKLKIFFKGLNENGERSVNLSHSDRVEIVDIIRKHGQVISKSSNKIQVMDMVSYETIDCTAHPELFDALVERDNVTFIEHKNAYEIIEKRES